MITEEEFVLCIGDIMEQAVSSNYSKWFNTDYFKMGVYDVYSYIAKTGTIINGVSYRDEEFESVYFSARSRGKGNYIIPTCIRKNDVDDLKRTYDFLKKKLYWYSLGGFGTGTIGG